MQRAIVVIKPGNQLDLSTPVVEGIVACCTCRLKQWLVVVHLYFVATGGSFVLALRLHCCCSHGSECTLKSVKWLASCSSLYEKSLLHSFILPTLYFCRDRLSQLPPWPPALASGERRERKISGGLTPTKNVGMTWTALPVSTLKISMP